MARKKKKKNSEGLDTQEVQAELQVVEKKHNKFVSAIIAILIILIWLGIFVVLVKLDVGGFGNSVLRPIIKDVPILKEILPVASDEEILDSGDYPYKSLSEAIEYIKELELELQNYQQTDTDSTSKIEELQAEVDRLKTFEDNNVAFEAQKSAFYEEVVFGDNAIDYENYKTYYESIDAENAAKIYKEVIEKETYDEKYKEYAKTYSNMKPAEAAKIFLQMTSDLDTVVGILNNMSASSRGGVLGAMSSLDPAFAAKVTQLLSP